MVSLSRGSPGRLWKKSSGTNAVRWLQNVANSVTKAGYFTWQAEGEVLDKGVKKVVLWVGI